VPVDVATLTDLINDEIIKAMGLSVNNRRAHYLRPIFTRATCRFSQLFAEVDQIVAGRGLAEGARALLSQLVDRFEVCGAERVPEAGPLVVASNHPGTVDSAVIASAITRPDFKILAGPIPFLQHLPNISRHVIYAPAGDPYARMQVVRASLRHLERGGSLLLFARGRIDPDPSFMGNADADLGQWSRSLELFLGKIPRARVLITAVSGVLHPRFMHHPITWLRRAREDRQRLAMMAQVIQQMLGRRIALTPRVTFGELISEESAGGRERILPSIIESARALLLTQGHGSA